MARINHGGKEARFPFSRFSFSSRDVKLVGNSVAGDVIAGPAASNMLQPASFDPQPPVLDPQSAVVDRQRLDAVLQTGLLETPPEESFDRLTRLAAKLIGVPTTFISLVDESRDFYRAVSASASRSPQRDNSKGAPSAITRSFLRRLS